jgi:hydroxymethylbilane synthase
VAESSVVRVGTRGSTLALRQTEEVLEQLRPLHPALDFQIVVVRTQGDTNATAPLAGMGLGIFVKEIEQQLLSGQLDLAVHSLKDLPTRLPQGLDIGAVLQRQDPRDVLVNKWGCSVSELPEGARIGTSSPRRVAQLKNCCPRVNVLPIRGNVETRLRKARGDEYDGAVLAAAGLVRLGLTEEITEYLSPQQFVPPPGQGALAVEARSGDTRMLELLQTVEHPPTRTVVTAERGFLEALGGGCQVPVGAYAHCDGDALLLAVFLGSTDGGQAFRADVRGSVDQPLKLAREAYQALAEQGAGELLEAASAG